MTEWLHFHFSLSCIAEGNGNPLQCSCLENPRDRGAWWAAIYGVTQSRTRLRWLSSSSSSSPLSIQCLSKWKWKLVSHVQLCHPIGLYSPWYSPGQNTGVGSHFPLQGVFPTLGSNLGLPYCGKILYQLSHQGSPVSTKLYIKKN